ncbi:uncharacterized protein ACR2FA_001615 [Aphomia sociella]
MCPCGYSTLGPGSRSLRAKVRMARRHASQGEYPTQREEDARGLQLRQILMDKWKERLVSPSAGHRTVEAIRPSLTEWVSKGRGPTTFRMTQILSGHGCFGRYLFRIKREEAAERDREIASSASVIRRRRRRARRARP